VLEAVPNVSEGRDAAAIGAIGEAFSSRARLLDVHSDADHHRSVYTLVGNAEDLVESLLAGIAAACRLIDLRRHDGVHPRVGAADVVPLVPLRPDDLEQAKSAALSLGERVGRELGLTVLLYGELREGRRPAFYRRGGLEELERRLASGELQPDFGPSHVDPRSGAVLVGARKPLVAYNLDLSTDDPAVAKEVAAAVRESGGGMPGVQAIGLRLPRSGRIQVSMNVLDLERSPLHEVVEAVTREAAARGVGVAGGELVGLVPASVLDAARDAGVAIPGVDESRVLERLVAL
jgi:glutamate formiminotransferase/glutamate formiminotransferase/formiminotetrahydrofolate cyclodeaminase